ncbi:aromatic acid/H+ symport family MFS transporter, partial [Corynebacterium diphtheriae]
IMFFIAGVPLLLLPLIWKFLPESLTFLVKAQKHDNARHMMQRLDDQLSLNDQTQLALSEIKIAEPAFVQHAYVQLWSLPMFIGYAVGGVMAALLGAWFTPNFGWQSCSLSQVCLYCYCL